MGRQELAAAKGSGAIRTQVEKLIKDLQFKQQITRNELLEEGSHYNFPKMHIMIHYCDQIEQYRQLPQYSIEVGQAYHRPLKDIYRRTNHIDATPQILKTYARDHAFAMRDLNVTALSLPSHDSPKDLSSAIIPPPTTRSAKPDVLLHQSFIRL